MDRTQDRGPPATTMGRHRDTGAGTRPNLDRSGAEVRSHRRPPGVARARAVSLVAVGALAGGVAIASATVPWSRDASQARPEPRPGGAPGTPGTGPGVLPVPQMPPPVVERPARSATVPVLAPTLVPAVPTDPSVRADVPPPTVWRADGPGAFRGTSWNTVGAVPPRVNDDEVVFQLSGRGQRSELEPALPAVHEGDQHDLTFSVRLDGEFAPGSAARQVIARWENDSPGQAPLDLRVSGDELVLHGGEGHPSGPRTFSRTLGRASLGEWTQLRVLVRFSADPDKAAVSVWRDGRPVVDDDHPRGGTLYPGQQSYLKVGLHRDRTIAAPSTVRFSAWRVDHGPAADDPTRRGPSRDDSPIAVSRSTRSSDDGRRSPRTDAPDRRSATSAQVGSERDVAPHAPSIRRDTSPDDRSDRAESEDGSSSERRAMGSSERKHRSSRSDSSHRRTSEVSSSDASDHDESEDSSTTARRSEPDRRPSHQDPSPRGASEDAGSRRGSSGESASADRDAAGGDDSREG